jgi:uncharacterized protein YegP (UPF0339 family)
MLERIEYWLSGKNGLWYFRIIGQNGKVRVESGGHSSKEVCLDKIHQSIYNSANVEIRELEPEIMK